MPGCSVVEQTACTYLLWSIYNSPNENTILLSTLQFSICETFDYFTTSNMEGVGYITLRKLGSNVWSILTFLLIPFVCNQLKKKSIEITSMNYVRCSKCQQITGNKNKQTNSVVLRPQANYTD
jgi:hypothetical protein